jgi:hypothetical protein
MRTGPTFFASSWPMTRSFSLSSFFCCSMRVTSAYGPARAAMSALMRRSWRLAEAKRAVCQTWATTNTNTMIPRTSDPSARLVRRSAARSASSTGRRLMRIICPPAGGSRAPP